MQSAKEVRYFLFSQQLADGLRVTMAVVLPALVLFQLGYVAIGFAISLGAMCVNLPDAPGPILHRKNAMLITAGITFIVAVITAAVKHHLVLLGVEIVVFTFLFSLFQVYGLRATNVGNAGILLMILTMGQPGNSTPLQYGLYILAGGLWYISIALLFYHIRPYRPAQRVLGDCIRALANYVSIKALFYDVHTDLQEDYKKLVAQQAVVHEKQDAVREFFFKTARIVNETTDMGRRLVATFVHTVDLFEDATATYYNYSTLRKRFEQSTILQPLAVVIQQLAAELDGIGIAIQANQRYTSTFDMDTGLIELKKGIDAIKEKEPEENTVILKKILVNIRRIAQHINEIKFYFDPSVSFSKSHVDHTRFIGHQSLDPRLLLNNFNMQSAAFKHALRVAIACIVGFTISKLLAYGQHSYWVLMTISFMLKPAFSLTKTRNVERIMGTLAGGLIGMAVLFLIHNTTALFVIMVVLMVGTYTFLRTRYLVMVVFTTAYILILFQFLNIPFIHVVQERVFDTVLGCVIAFSAGYLLFPDWEAHQIKKHMAEVLLANAAYLQNVTGSLEGKPIDNIVYKLARKQVYVQSANLATAYQRMAAEPRRRQHQTQLVHQFQVRNHLLFSNIAHLATLINDAAPTPHYSLAHSAQKAIEKLYRVSKKLDAEAPVPKPYYNKLPPIHDAGNPTASDEDLLKTNVDFIAKLCEDICQTTDAILAA